MKTSFLFCSVLTFLIAFSSFQCKQEVLSLSEMSETVSTPDWVQNLITEYKNHPAGNPDYSIWQYRFKGQTVYYLPPQCCDKMSVLLSKDSTVICHPDGGYAGNGDGNCPDFFDERENGKLIWKDNQ